MFYRIHRASSKGFTLIELIVVFSVIAVLSTIGIATFSNYKNEETFRTSYLELVSNLYLMRSKAVAQVKPVNCQNAQFTLTAYSLVVQSGNKSYQLQGECKLSPNNPNEQVSIYDTKVINLPPGVKFYSVGTMTFPVLTNEFSTQSLKIESDTLRQAKTVTVDSTGGVSVKDDTYQ